MANETLEKKDTVSAAESAQIGLYLTGQVMIPPKFYAENVNQESGEKRPATFQVTLFYGARDMATFYLPPNQAAALQAGDVVTVGPCRTGRNGALYLVDRQ